MRYVAPLSIVSFCVLAVVACWPSSSRKTVPLAPVASLTAGETPALSAPPLRAISSEASPLKKEKAAVSDCSETVHLRLRAWFSAQASDSEDEQDRVMKELVALLTDDNAAEIIRSLSKEELNTPFALAALRRWMQVDLAKATNWIAGQTGGSENLLNAAVAEEWAHHKTALFAYADQLPNSRWKETLLTNAGLALSIQDPHGAIDLAQRMSPGIAQTSLLQAVLCDWISLEPNAALNWIIDVNQPELRDQLTASAAKAYALAEPSLAASWSVSNIQSPEVRKEAVLNIVETWGSRDPENAAKWAASSLEGETRKAALEIISTHWTKSDSDAADEWFKDTAKRGT